MNKTISINLGGTFFHIEEAAYQQLDEYLNGIHTYFSKEEGCEEIVDDIESRIAEMFSELLEKYKRQVVLPADVKNMITIMGKPEQFDDPTLIDTTENTQNNPTKKIPFSNQNHNSSANEGKATKRLYRDTDDKIIGGVCSGLSAYFGIADPVWLRIAFAVLFFVYGYGLMLYIVLMIILPKAKTSSEKLAMRGEPINVANIEKMFKDGSETLENFGKKINETIDDFNKGDGKKKINFFFSNLIQFSHNILAILIPIALKLVRLFVIITGFILLFSLGVSIIAGLVALLASAKFLATFIFSSMPIIILGVACSFFSIAIPLLVLGYFLFRRLFNISPKPTNWGRALLAVWLLSLLGTAIIGYEGYNQNFDSKSFTKHATLLSSPASKKLFIDIGNNLELKNKIETENLNKNNISMGFGNNYATSFFFNNTQMFKKLVELNIEKSTNDSIMLVKTLSSMGGDVNNADQLASHIQYSFSQADSVLNISNFFSFPIADKWRGQNLQLTLFLPEGTQFSFSEKAKNIPVLINKYTSLNNLQYTYQVSSNGIVPIKPFNKAISDNNNTLETPQATSYTEMNIPEVNNNEIKKDFDLNDFDAIDVSGTFDLEVVKGDHFSVTFIGDKNAIEALDVNVDDNRLNVSLNNINSWLNLLKNKDVPVIKGYITMPSLININESGASTCTINGFDEEDITIEISGASSGKVNSKAQNFDIELSGASKLNISGVANYASISVSGVAEVNAYNLMLNNAEVDASGASKINLSVIQELEADASGVSKINYKGNPQSVKSDLSGAANIAKIDN